MRRSAPAQTGLYLRAAVARSESRGQGRARELLRHGQAWARVSCGWQGWARARVSYGKGLRARDVDELPSFGDISFGLAPGTLSGVEGRGGSPCCPALIAPCPHYRGWKMSPP
jgi:hypothetical protein